MAKRHPALIPLAREHHDALLLAVRLQQGRRALLRLWSHDPLTQAKLVATFYRSHLLRHFRAEEEILFPSIERHTPVQRTLLNTLLDDHRWFHHAVEKIEGTDADGLASLLPEFGKRLEAHIRVEDRTLFLEFERDASEQILQDVQSHMEAFYARPPEARS